MTTPTLLNDDGTASMATTVMMSHHGFRRDLARFVRALEALGAGETARATALSEEWQRFHQTLHGHHSAEDAGLFPSLAAQQPQLRETIARLDADHRRIDPLLERGDEAFRDLGQGQAALGVVRELLVLLEPHLAIEEAELIPFLREARSFPEPAGDSELELYAQGFAWAMQGIADDVLSQVQELLPLALASRLPQAREAFDARCVRVWGSAKAGATRTPLPAL